MKKYPNLKHGFLLIFFLRIVFSNAQTYVVTDKYMGNSGSYDQILFQAINSANAGNNVTILFNAPGLCQIDNVMPAITITNGSITMDIHSSAAPFSQGFESSPSIPQYFVYAAIEIGNTSNTNVTIKNLKFTNLHDIGGAGINIDGANNVLVKGCRFEEYVERVLIRNSDNITIDNNTFFYIATSGARKPEIFMTESGTKTQVSHYFITNNTFYNSNPSVSPIPSNPGNAIIFWNFMNGNINDNIQITGNNVSNYPTGVWIINSTSNNTTVDNTLQLNIQNNTLLNYGFNIAIEKPYKHFNIDNNMLSIIPDVYSPTSNITLYSPVTSPSPFGLDFIKSNTLGLPIKNGNNTFQSTALSPSNYNVVSYNAFSMNGEFSQENRIAGLNLPGRVIVVNGKNTLIRQNKILSNNNGNPSLPNSDLPILLNDGYNPVGNGNIQKPNLNLAYLTYQGTNKFLNVDFNLPGLNSVNGDFAVDFYKSNSNGDLVDNIGSYTITTLSASYFTTVLVPNTVNLNNGDRVGVTVTSLGNISYNPLGTSQVSYIIMPVCPLIVGISHVNLNDAISCQKFEFNTNIAGYNSPACPNSSLVTSWNFGDLSPNSIGCADAGGALATHQYSVAGTYTVSLTITGPGTCISTSTDVVTVMCTPFPCSDCIPSFSPIPGKKYILSAWVKENNPSQSKTNYTYPKIYIIYPSLSFTTSAFQPSGQIIDGWQRVEGEFLIPPTATDLKIKLDCSTGDCFFDDIRVFPFDGSMKSYVYDPVTMRLSAELDERNYATLYEYDEEGKLIRVKKETEKGKMTIQENRNNTKK